MFNPTQIIYWCKILGFNFLNSSNDMVTTNYYMNNLT